MAVDLNLVGAKGAIAEEAEGKWGMVIDQDICTGCQACVAACAMENNLSFVGEEDAGYGRTQHWIRIERFWEGAYPEIKATPFQPMLCQQCGHAPCEPVCPVFATPHSLSQDINLQVYNRCVGTRYCANNCPYQVRSFNWRDYHTEPLHANEVDGQLVFPLHNQFNPDVTVRRRGVMEKCTFCIQRIHKAEDTAKSQGREVHDGEMVPACAQACPANAITFGRLDDHESLVSQLAHQDRGVKHLEELNTLPRVTYLKEGQDMAVTSKYFGAEKGHEAHHEEEHDPRQFLMYDPKPRGEMNAMVMESMMTTSWRFWVVFGILAFLVATCFFYAWGYMIAEGLWVAGVMRPSYWGIFLVNTVFWIGISHAGTFISAILRVMKAEFRRPFTRAAELMTTFGLIQAGASIFMHLGRVWLAYWLFPIPNERQLWPNFHSPLMWDLLAITTYVLGSTMYLFLPLIPDLAMARDRSTGWRKTFFKILALGFRGTEGEWRHLQTAMNIFALAIIPVMFSVHTIVSWDFAMAMRPGWSSTVFGPYFVLGALHSGMGAVAVVLFIMRYTMKHMDYFLRAEHFDALGKLMLVVTFAYTYFFFNDYIVQWYGGDKWTDALLHWLEEGPMAWMFYQLLLFNLAVPALTLWNKKIRQTPWLLALIGLLINVGMYWERYLIIPVMLTINRMPFTWKLYEPRIEIFLTIGTFSLFLLFYLAASRLIPLIPVWEVQEGQMTHSLRKVGKAHVPTVSEFE